MDKDPRDPEAQTKAALHDTVVDGAGADPSLLRLPQRYRLGERLGSGATAEVFSVYDLAVDREIALKRLSTRDPRAIARFQREARVTARLEHPNIVPLHDYELTADGAAYFTMRRVRGRSLRAAIAEAAEAGQASALGPINDVLAVLIKVSEAVGRAHSHGIVHQDIKPDNIMLGSNGEVMVVDWGEARDLADAASGTLIVGTPLYMSPEQARGEPSTRSSDVYCLGGTLLHALTLRPPLTPVDAERFGVDKRAGTIDPFTLDEQRRLPRQLRAILLRALAPAVADRYPDAEAFAADLRAFQADRLVSAYSPTWPERAARWARTHALALSATGLGLLAVLVPLALLDHERSKDVARWGEPLVIERFTDESWRGRWTAYAPDAFTARDGRLISNGINASTLRFNRPLSGAIAIEFTGEMLAEATPGDLSVFWTPTTAQTTYGTPAEGFSIQVGAFQNSFCSIARIGEGDRAVVRERMEPGRRYRIRVEIEGSELRLLVDGRQVLEHVEPFPLGPGYLALYAYYPGKAFDEVAVYSRGLPERVGVLAMGDVLYQAGQFGAAAEQFLRVRDSHPGTPLAEEALYKGGIALTRANDLNGAWRLWDGISTSPFREHVEARRVARLLDGGHWSEGLALLGSVYARAPWTQAELRAIWAQRIRHACNRPEPDLAEVTALLVAWQRLFAGDGACRPQAIDALMLTQRWEEAAAHAGDDPRCWKVLMSLGRYDEALRRMSSITYVRRWVHFQQGRLEEIAGDTSDTLDGRVAALAKLDRIDAALALVPDDVEPLLQAGRYERVLATSHDIEAVNLALLLHGRTQAVLHGDPAIPGAGRSADAIELARILAGDFPALLASDPLIARRRPWDALIDALERNDAPAIAHRREAALARRLDHDKPEEWFPRQVMLPWMEALASGDRAPWTAAMESAVAQERWCCGQRLWHLASFVTGRIDEPQFLAQPLRAESAAWLALAQGLQAELDGDRAAATAAYRRYRDLPWHRRLLNGFRPDTVVERFVAWRSALLR